MSMARVELRPSGQYTYAVVVEDLQEGGAWRKKVIGSFGNAADPKNVQKAHVFANAVNAGKSLIAASAEAEAEDILKALGVVVGAAVAALAIAWLFREQ